MHVHMGVLPQREGRHSCSSTHVKWRGRHGQVSQVKSTYKPSGSPAGSLSRFLTRNISTRAPVDGMLVHRRVTPSIQFAGTHFGWREALWEWSLFPKNTTQCPPPGLESGTLDRESSSLTMRPPRIFFSPLTWKVSPRKVLFLWLRLFSLRDMQLASWVQRFINVTPNPKIRSDNCLPSLLPLLW